MNYFKGTTQTFTNIQVAPGVFNKNLKMFMEPAEDEEQQTATEEMGGSEQRKLPRGLNDKAGKH